MMKAESQTHPETTVSLAEKLIACPSVTPDDAGCQTIIQQRLDKMGFISEPLILNDVTNLWSRIGNSGPLFVFSGHTDVVPPGPEKDWSSPPFIPEIRNGFLYGRGASDMKSAIAAMVVAVEQFITENKSFKGSIGFLLTSDEEGPSIDGTRRVIEKLTDRGIAIDYCLIGEASSEKQVGDQIRVGRRGSLHAKLIIHGKQGHVAYPHLVKNPIHLSALMLHQLAETDWDKGNDDFPPTTFQITNIHSGTGAKNVVPGHLEILFNFRFGTTSTVQTLQSKTEAILNQFGLNYEIEWTLGGEPFLTQQGKLIKETRNAIKEVTGLTTHLSTGGGTSDGRFIAPTGAEVVELGLVNATAHHVNECVKVNDIEILTKIYQQILNKIFC